MRFRVEMKIIEPCEGFGYARFLTHFVNAKTKEEAIEKTPDPEGEHIVEWIEAYPCDAQGRTDYVVLVTGSRDWDDRETIFNIFKNIQSPYGNDTNLKLIHGGCRGADELALACAVFFGYEEIKVKADWKLGKKAGPIRNKKMVDMKPDLVIAFQKGQSRGTQNCMEYVMAAGIPFIWIRK